MQFTEANSKKESGTDLESCCTRKTEYTKDNGTTTCETAEATKGTQMRTDTKAISNPVKLTEKAFTPGRMEKCTTANGKTVSNKVTEFGGDFLEILILGSGLKVKLKGMECISGRMGIGMRGSGLTVLNMARVRIFLLIKMYILGVM